MSFNWNHSRSRWIAWWITYDCLMLHHQLCLMHFALLFQCFQYHNLLWHVSNTPFCLIFDFIITWVLNLNISKLRLTLTGICKRNKTCIRLLIILFYVCFNHLWILNERQSTPIMKLLIKERNVKYKHLK